MQKKGETIWYQNQIIILQSLSQKFVGYRNIKPQVLINKLVYLGLSMLELSKSVMYGFWYNYVEPKYAENAKLCDMDTQGFTVY